MSGRRQPQPNDRRVVSQYPWSLHPVRQRGGGLRWELVVELDGTTQVVDGETTSAVFAAARGLIERHEEEAR